MNKPVIEAFNVSKMFGKVTALDGVSIEVDEGKVMGLLGHNGAGKTTLVNILTTMLPPTSGTARVAGFDVTKDGHQIRSRIGLTGQFAAVDEDLSGRDNLVLIARLLGASTAEARSRADELLAVFDLTDAAKRLAKTYSGGMRRRLDLSASLVGHPDVIFLDEPTTGLDPRSRRMLWQSVAELRARGIGVLLTTQYLEEADTLADQVVIISTGRVADTGTPAGLKARFGTVVFQLGFSGQATAEAAHAVLAAAGHRPERDGASVRVRSAAGSGALTGVLRALDGRAPDPVSVAVREPTLDDVFLSLTREGEAA